MSYLIFAVIMVIGQFSPGPDMLLLTKNALNHTLRASLFTVAGITTGIAFHTIVALTGLILLLKSAPAWSDGIRYAGAAYLAFLGIRLFLSLRRPVDDENAKLRPAGAVLSDGSAYRQGLLTNLLNPKAVAFFSGVLSQFIQEDSSSIERIIYGAIIIFEAGFFWTIYVYLLQHHVIKSAFLRAERKINFIFAILLLSLAAYQLFP